MSVPVSIIIPVFKDWERLRLCLQALSNQTFPKDQYEVIVVNNHPTDLPPFDLSDFSNVICITEPQPGSYAARNAGLRMAKGEIIGFTDSDCIPHKNWIQNAVAYLAQNPNCRRVAGEIRVIQRSNRPTLIEVYNQLYSFPQKGVIKFHGGSMTANLFTYRHVFDSVGLFNDTFFSYGDMEWGQRAQKAGFRIDFVENVIVGHPVRELHELIQKERRLGGGLAHYYHTRQNRILAVVRFIVLFCPRTESVKYVLEHKNKMSPGQLAMIPLLRYYFGVIRGFERLSVSFGKKPSRS